MAISSDGRTTCLTAMRFLLTKVPLVDFRSSMTIFPSWATSREWYLDTFPLERTMSFPSRRPMVTWAFSNWICWLEPPFSATVTRNMGPDASASVEDPEVDLSPRLLVPVLHVVDDLPDLVRVRVDDARRDEDHQLALGLVEPALLEQLPQDGDVAQARQLAHRLLLVVAEHPGEHDGLPVPDGDVGDHLAGAEAGHRGGAAEGHRHRGVQLRRLGVDLGLDVAVAVRGGADPHDDAVGLVLHRELVVGDQRDGHLPAGDELRL